MADDETGEAGAKGGQGPAITAVAHRPKGVHSPAGEGVVPAEAERHKAPEQIMDPPRRSLDREYGSMADARKDSGRTSGRFGREGMMNRRSLTIGAAVASVFAASGARGQTARQTPRPAASGARNAVLVHGAFADGSSWAGVIARLQNAGMRVVAVQNPLTSLADDVAATRRALSMMDGPTVLVGHSYGGNVISEAGVDPKVVSLVYVAALAPEPGEGLEDMTRGHPPAPGLAHVRAGEGFAHLDETGYLNDFAPDVPRARARVMYAAQGPVAADLFGQKTTQAAWRDKRSWYVVATQDRMILPVVQRALAKKIGATAVDVLASHAVPVSHPAEVARVIQTAARARARAA